MDERIESHAQSSVVARNINIINIERDHGEDPVCLKDANAWVIHVMPPSLSSQHVAKKIVKLSTRLLQTVQATSQVEYIICTVVEPHRLSGVDVLNGRAQLGGIDVKTPKLEIVSNCNFE
jgi:hypothetical protein